MVVVVRDESGCSNGGGGGGIVNGDGGCRFCLFVLGMLHGSRLFTDSK